MPKNDSTVPTGMPGSYTIHDNPPAGRDRDSIVRDFINHLEFSLAKDEFTATKQDCFKAIAYTTRDRLIEDWILTQQEYYKQDAKRVYYLSLEYLIGRTLGNSLINQGLYRETSAALHDLGLDLEDIREVEWDAGLGNGGLGRLAACFLDSMATLALPAYGYGIRYEYGIFKQKIVDGYQEEHPDNWLRRGNPWEIQRPEYLYPVQFYGRTESYRDEQGRERFRWIDTANVMAMGYDTPVPGYNNKTVNNLRLWEAHSTRDFNLSDFNRGDYESTIIQKHYSEIISKVLYPNDSMSQGRELRLRQEYFFVSASLQDIIRRYLKSHETFDLFAERVAIQLNDTHPAIGIPELMRILMDDHGLDWERAWEITTGTFAYTNHTLLPEALEKWSVPLLSRVLPRHMDIIFEINRRFLEEIRERYPADVKRLREMSIIEETEPRQVRMAYLAIIGSHSVNGVAELHSSILRKSLFRSFYDIYPTRFNNKTNGITQRRWLRLCNPGLAELISSRIGEEWIGDLEKIRRIEEQMDDPEFRERWVEIKQANRKTLADYIRKEPGVSLPENALFDCQIKRIHEYKRQLLNLLHVITRYNRIREGSGNLKVPRVVIFAGKAAPGYARAKEIIKLINDVAEVINSDPKAEDLKVVFIPNYSVSLAEKIIPAADLSEQISTAGMEASGTGNMKFALNGALTIGTLDGANIEIRDHVGDENIFIFGLNSDEVEQQIDAGYDPRSLYRQDGELREALDMIAGGFFSPHEPDRYSSLVSSLLEGGDRYLLLADYRSYILCQEEVDNVFLDRDTWLDRSIRNVAGIGFFSTDRTIARYAEEIWRVKPVPAPGERQRGKQK